MNGVNATNGANAMGGANARNNHLENGGVEPEMIAVVVTALGPDNVGLADPIIHELTGRGGRIAEIQMYDHDEQQLFAMLCRVDLPADQYDATRQAMAEIASRTGLAVRVWSRPSRSDAKRRIRLAVAGTFVADTPEAILVGCHEGHIDADVAVMMSNRRKLQPLAERFEVPFRYIGREKGQADDEAIVAVLDEFEIDYLILARYMRILPASTCWQFAGGRIINLHHGLLPGFPGFRPYHDAYAARMLTYGATCHFIIPELDAGNQTINQRTFSIDPGTDLDAIISHGERENEPACLAEGVRRVVAGEVDLHFHRVVATKH